MLLLEQATSDMDKMDLYEKVLEVMNFLQDPAMGEYADALQQLALKNNSKIMLPWSYLHKGEVANMTGDYDNAIEYIWKSHDWHIKNGEIEFALYRLFFLNHLYSQIGDLEKQEKVLFDAVAIAEDLDIPSTTGIAHGTLSNHYKDKGEMDKALEHIDLSLEALKQGGELHDDYINSLLRKASIVGHERPIEGVKVLTEAAELAKENHFNFLLAAIYRELAEQKNKLGQKGEAIDYAFKGIEVAERSNEPDKAADCYRMLGDIYKDMEQYEEATEYYEKSYDIAKRIGFSFGEMTAAASIGLIKLQVKEYDSAIQYFKQGLQHPKESANVKAEFANELSYAYLQKGDLDNFFKAYRLSDSLNVARSEILIQKQNLYLAKYYKQKGNITQVKKYALSAFKHGDKTGNLAVKGDAAELLYNVFESENNIPLAFKYLKAYRIASDSLRNDENLKKITTLKLNNEFQKEKEILVLEQAQQEELLKAETKQTRTAAMGFGSFAILALGFFFNARRKNQLISAQNKQLESLNHTKDRIFAIIGHDLRKPAASFRGISKKVKHLIKKQDFERLDRFGNQIEQNALSLNKLTDNLLNWALTQRDVMPYNPIEVSLSDLVADIHTIFETPANEKNIQIINNVSESTTVFADPNALSAILTNLVDNAVKYTPEGGQIRIEALEEANNQLKIRVADTGIGMEKDKINDLFLLKKDKSEKGTAGEKGTGLGLHLVKELVELNKGIISAASEIGKGTSFDVLLPRVQEAH